MKIFNTHSKCSVKSDTSLFRNVIMVAFQSIIHLKIYQNNIFFIYLKSDTYLNGN